MGGIIAMPPGVRSRDKIPHFGNAVSLALSAAT